MNFVFEQHRETIFNLQKMIFGLTIKKKTDILILYDINVQMSERRRQYDIGGAKTTYAGVFMNKITNTKAPKRNYVLELWRFIFCIMVLGFHFFSKIDSRLFHAGYLGVEFFFLVSGYFIGSFYFRQLEDKDFRNRLKSVGHYIISRFKRLYPLYFAALIIMLIIKLLTGQLTFSMLPSTLKDCYAEFFMLQWTPLGNEVLISADWYVPAVFFGGIFFIILLSLTGRVGGYLLAPAISFFLYRYYFLLIGKIDIIIYHHCILRGIAGLGLGIFIYFICSLVPAIPAKLTWPFFILSNLIVMGVFIYSQFGHRSKWDFFIIGLYTLSLFLLMIADTPGMPGSMQKAFGFLGKTTYPIYILQMPVIELILSTMY